MENIDEELNEELKAVFEEYNIQVLPSNPNYWLIRTEGGSFYQTFVTEGYVSIGFEKINLDDIAQLKRDDLKNIIKELHPDSKRPGIILNSLYRFSKEVKIGDIIIIPSKNSRNLCIGQATSKAYQIAEKIKKEEIEDEIYTYQKRIDVKWIAEISKNNFDIYVFRLLNTHQCILNINSYRNIINRMIFPFYYQDGAIHVSLYVSSHKPISLSSTNNLLALPVKLAKLYEDFTGDIIDKENISLKSTINSPGSIEVFGSVIPLVIFGAFVFGIGGKFTRKTSKTTADGSKKETETTFESEGFLSKLSSFLHQKNNDELEKPKTESDIAFKALEIKNEKNNNYLTDINNESLDTVKSIKNITSENNVKQKNESMQQSFFDD